MFDPWCPTCEARVLLTARRLVGLVTTAAGHRADLLCWCGTVVALEVARTRPGGTPAPAPAPPSARDAA